VKKNYIKDEMVIKAKHELNKRILDKIGVPNSDDIPSDLQDAHDHIYETVKAEAHMPETDLFTPEENDTLITAELLLPKGDILVPAHVVGQKQHKKRND
jgi:hypothetical protein